MSLRQKTKFVLIVFLFISSPFIIPPIIKNDFKIPLAEGAAIDDEWQHREWSYVYGGTNEQRFFQSGGTSAYLDHSGAGRGYVWFWIDFSTAYLDGKYLNITWSSLGNHISKAFIVDTGNYSRTYNPNFKNNSGVDDIGMNLNWGAGLVQTLWTTAGVQPQAERSYLVNLAAATDSRVTLVFQSRDWTITNPETLILQRLEIVNPLNMSDILWEEEFDGCVNYDLPDTNPARYGTMCAAPFALPPCIVDSADFTNPSAIDLDGFGIAIKELQYYSFYLTFDNVNLSRDHTFSMGWSDDLYFFIINYTFIGDDDQFIYGDYEILNDLDKYIVVAQFAQQPLQYDSNTYTLTIAYWIFWEKEANSFHQKPILGHCGPDNGWVETDEKFSLIESGGYREKVVQNGSYFCDDEILCMCGQTGNLSLTTNSTTIAVNQTWYRPVHWGLEYALRFYVQATGEPEDQFMQDYSHSGPPLGVEDWSNPGLWSLQWFWWAWDNATSEWVLILWVQQQMEEGDEGVNDEWIRTRTWISTNGTSAFLAEDYWVAFIEEEHGARYRTWLDMWISKTNASSYIAARQNAYYFGMENEPWIGLFANWKPMLDNRTQFMAEMPINLNNGTNVRAQKYDVIKLGVELQVLAGTVYGVDQASQNYTVCLEDVNINEVKVMTPGQVIEGVNTPIYNAPKVPDMPIGSILSALYSGLSSLGKFIVESLSGVLNLVWDFIYETFPWFGQTVEAITELLVQIGTFFGEIWSALLDGISIVAGNFWIFTMIYDMIGDTWAQLAPVLEPFTDNANEWITLFIIIFGIIPFAHAVSIGDMEQVSKDLNFAWRLFYGIFKFGFDLISRLVGWILEAIPL